MGAASPGGTAHVRDRLEDYLLGTLAEEEEFSVETHLFGCAECRAECDALTQIAVMVPTSRPRSSTRSAPDRPGPARARRVRPDGRRTRRAKRRGGGQAAPVHSSCRTDPTSDDPA